MSPRASIVIPLLRQVDEWLEKAVESALAQTVPCDVVVVTSPRTPEGNRRILSGLAARSACLRVIEREPSMRFAAALNLGFRSALCDRVGLLLTDDWLDPRAVELCLRHDAAIVSTGRTFYAANGETVLYELCGRHTLEAYERLQTQADRANYLGHFLMFRREALLAAGGADETIGDSPGVDDFDLIWTMLDKGASVSIIEQPLYNYRDHAGERLTTRKRGEMLATFCRILDKHGVHGPERETLIARHSPWFGVPILVQHRESNGGPVPLPRMLEPLRTLYRAAVPYRARTFLHERVLRPVLGGTKS